MCRARLANAFQPNLTRTLEQAALQRRAFPSARVVTLPDTGHWAMHERPGDLRDIVLPFLHEQTAR